MPATQSLPRLRAVTTEIDAALVPDTTTLIALASPSDPLVWWRRGAGFVGIGDQRAATVRVSADERYADERDAASATLPRAARLADEWRALSASAVVDDRVGAPGTGLVGFGVSTFSDASPTDAVIVVPRTIVGRSGGRTWMTRISDADEHTAPAPDDDTVLDPLAPIGAPWSATLAPGALDAAGYQRAVAAAVRRIERGDASKIVLARDLQGTIPWDADLRRLVLALADAYADTWIYAVDGMIGASPETLVTAHGAVVTARVLAGTAARGTDPDHDAAAAVSLAASTKDTSEHRYAVRSVLQALRPHVATLAAAEHPFTLALPNVWHLATDVSGTVAGDASVLDLVAALHPTAAVGGTPTTAALAAIAAEEPTDRGRYAAPVGWIDHTGDGEWAIALRGAQVGAREPGAVTRPVTARAGAGIVAASDPAAELAETRAKFRPIVEALG